MAFFGNFRMRHSREFHYKHSYKNVLRLFNEKLFDHKNHPPVRWILLNESGNFSGYQDGLTETVKDKKAHGTLTGLHCAFRNPESGFP